MDRTGNQQRSGFDDSAGICSTAADTVSGAVIGCSVGGSFSFYPLVPTLHLL